MFSQLHRSNCIQIGARVIILYAKFLAGYTGTVIAQEKESSGLQTGYWLVQVEGTDILLALLKNEMELLKAPHDSSPRPVGVIERRQLGGWEERPVFEQ